VSPVSSVVESLDARAVDNVSKQAERL